MSLIADRPAVPSLLPPRAALALLLTVELAAWRGAQISARDIHARLELRLRHAETLLQALKAAGILDSARGPRGGYRLTRPAAEISAGDVVRAAFAAALAPSAEIGGCGPAQAMAIVAMENQASAAFMRILDSVSLSELQRGALHRLAGAAA